MRCPQCQRVLAKIRDKDYACMVCGYTRWFKKSWREKRGYGVSWLALLDGRAIFKPMQTPIADTAISGFDRATHYRRRFKDHSFLLKWYENEGRVLIGNFFEPIEVFKETDYSTYLGFRISFNVYYDVEKLNKILSGSMYHRVSRVYKNGQQTASAIPEINLEPLEKTVIRKEAKDIALAAIETNYLLCKELFNKLDKELVS